jgi:hypothetical protein
VVWLCLVILPTQSRILEKRLFRSSVFVGILKDLDVQNLVRPRVGAAPGGLPARQLVPDPMDPPRHGPSYPESLEGALSCA